MLYTGELFNGEWLLEVTEFEFFVADIVFGRFGSPEETLKQLEGQAYDNSFLNYLKQSNAAFAEIADSVETHVIPSPYRDLQAGKRTPKPNYTALSIQEMFDICDERNYMKLSKIIESKVRESHVAFLNKILLGEWNHSTFMLAARVLGTIGTVESFQCLKSFIETNADKKGAVFAQAMRRVENTPPEVCLDTGREWFLSHKHTLRLMGERILEAHASFDDIAMLRETITLCSDTGDMYRLCSAIDALDNFPNIGFIPEVEHAYHEVPYSFARKQAARTMLTNTPYEFAAEYAYECLHDCEYGTKIIGMEGVNTHDSAAAQRIKELAEDPYQDEDIRNRASELNRRC